MKVILISLGFLLVFGCSSKDVGSNEENKIIQIKCTIGDDTLNTFNNTFTRVYRDTGVYVIPFNFTLEEQQRIVSKMDSVNFLGLPDSLAYHNQSFDLNSGIEDVVFSLPGEWGNQFVDIFLKGKKKKVFWIEYLSYKKSDEFLRLNSVMKIIREIIWSRKEVKKLPEQVWY